MKEITQDFITYVKDFYHYLKNNGEMPECFQEVEKHYQICFCKNPTLAAGWKICVLKSN